MEGKVKEIKTELVECIETQCGGQFNLPQEQGETVCSLEVDCDQASPVGPCEVERVHGTEGYMPSLGGAEASGSLELTQTPSVIVPECVLECASGVSVMACASACGEMAHGPIQTGDGNGEPGRPHKVILVTAPAPRDVGCEARPVCCARLHDQNLALKRLVRGTKLAHARLKGRLCEFGKHGSQCECMCVASRAACHVFCSRNAWSEFPGRHARAGLHGKPRRFRVRVTSPGISQRELQVSSTHRPAWRMAQRRVLVAINGATLRPHVSPIWRGRACCKPPPWRRKDGRALLRVHDTPARMWRASSPGQRSTR